MAHKGEAYPQISDRSDIIVITDEAHRSQYDIFALNMRNALGGLDDADIAVKTGEGKSNLLTSSTTARHPAVTLVSP